MGEATDEIEAHIESTREHLGENLQVLERKVKSVTDWRGLLKKNQGILLGVLISGGFLVAVGIGKRHRRHHG
jgi:hypothetical protein